MWGFMVTFIGLGVAFLLLSIAVFRAGILSKTASVLVTVGAVYGSLLRFYCVRMHYDCMTSITIRDVPDDVRDELAARARMTGRSLQEYLRMHLVGLASHPDPEVLVDQARERTRRTGTRLPAARILVHRDHDRR